MLFKVNIEAELEKLVDAYIQMIWQGRLFQIEVIQIISIILLL